MVDSVDFRDCCPPLDDGNIFATGEFHHNQNEHKDRFYYQSKLRKASGLSKELIDSTSGTIVDIGGWGEEFTETDRHLVSVDIEDTAIATSTANVAIGIDLRKIPRAFEKGNGSLQNTLQQYLHRLRSILLKKADRDTPLTASIHDITTQLQALTGVRTEDVGLYMLSQICVNLTPQQSQQLLETCIANVQDGGIVAVMDKPLCKRKTMPAIKAGNTAGFDLCRNIADRNPSIELTEFLVAPVIPSDEVDKILQQNRHDHAGTFTTIIDGVQSGSIPTIRLSPEEAGEREYIQNGDSTTMIVFAQHATLLQKRLKK